MKKVLIIVVMFAVLAAVGFGVYRFVNKSEEPVTNVTSASDQTNSGTQEPPADQQTSDSLIAAAELVTITYSNSGFSPNTVTVKTGGKVTIKNDSSKSVQFDSDPHPAHTDNEELNAEVIKAGQSETFTVTKAGTFGYHNHLNASETGTIIVQ